MSVPAPEAPIAPQQPEAPATHDGTTPDQEKTLQGQATASRLKNLLRSPSALLGTLRVFAKGKLDTQGENTPLEEAPALAVPKLTKEQNKAALDYTDTLLQDLPPTETPPLETTATTVMTAPEGMEPISTVEDANQAPLYKPSESKAFLPQEPAALPKKPEQARSLRSAKILTRTAHRSMQPPARTSVKEMASVRR